MPTVSSDQLQERLEGIDYPATKSELIDHVQMSNENEDMVMNVLYQLPEKEYENHTEVREEADKIT